MYCLGETLIQYVIVDGMAHAWSGGNSSGTNPFIILFLNNFYIFFFIYYYCNFIIIF